MANRHFAKLADVWKHGALTEVLAVERPSNYWETHAGNASYPMVDDAERRYGARTFVEVAPAFPALARSRYLAHLREINPEALTIYPGSPLLAMRELGDTATYLFCDTDPSSVADLEAAGSDRAHVRVVDSDGMTALHHELDDVGGTVLAHVDPYDPWATGPSGLSAVDLAVELIRRGKGLVYWYGYDQPSERAWAFDRLTVGAATIWCGDILVGGSGQPGGDLGAATTAGTGFEVVCANVSSAAIDACRGFGEDLVRAYRGIALPDGEPGYLDFAVRVLNR
jgi:23S rRNA (adenine(2030)-N(6))-methyltransferase RlmJ-like protein